MFPAEAAYLPVSTFWERLLILEVIFIWMPSFCICLCIWEMRNVSSRMRCELQVEIFLAVYRPPVVWSRLNPRHAVGCPGIPWRHAPACDVTLSAFDVTPKMQWRTVKKKLLCQVGPQGLSSSHPVQFVLFVTQQYRSMKEWKMVCSVKQMWKWNNQHVTIWVTDRIRTYDLPNTGRAFNLTQQQRKKGRFGIRTSYLFFKMSPNALFIHFFSHLWLYTRDRAARKWALTFLILVILILKDNLMWTKATKLQDNSPFPALFRVLPSRTSHERYLQIAWQIGHDNWGTSRIKRQSGDGEGAVFVKWYERIPKTDIACEIALHARGHARSREKETCCAFHRPKANLFCSKRRKFRVWCDSCVFLSNLKVCIHATCTKLIFQLIS